MATPAEFFRCTVPESLPLFFVYAINIDVENIGLDIWCMTVCACATIPNRRSEVVSAFKSTNHGKIFLRQPRSDELKHEVQLLELRPVFRRPYADSRLCHF